MDIFVKRIYTQTLTSNPYPNKDCHIKTSVMIINMCRTDQITIIENPPDRISESDVVDIYRYMLRVRTLDLKYTLRQANHQFHIIKDSSRLDSWGFMKGYPRAR